MPTKKVAAPKVSQKPQGRIFSILGIVFACIALLFFPIVFGPLAVIFGIIGIVKEDKVMGTIAIILGIVFSIISVVMVLILIQQGVLKV